MAIHSFRLLHHIHVKETSSHRRYITFFPWLAKGRKKRKIKPQSLIILLFK
jgi:hypothetical protein